MKILGISCFYHDSAVAAVEDGNILFAIQEERLSRVKHDSRFPIMAITRALEHCRWNMNDVDVVCFYENPDLKLRRLFDWAIFDWPRTWHLFSDELPVFYRYKYPMEQILRDKLRFAGKVRFCEHHRSHAASVFFTSPFERALVLTIDGVGEYETTAVHIGEGNRLRKVQAIHFPDSLGLLYSVFTQYLGFEVNDGEYKVMGLAPYGRPSFLDKILGKMIILHEDGSFHLNLDYFDFSKKERHYSHRFLKELGLPPRGHKEAISHTHEDLAASIQAVLEIALRNMVSNLRKNYEFDNVCFSGGVALNCTANADLVREFGFKLFVHPAASDAGGALGAALDVAIEGASSNPYRFPFTPYLGLDFTELAIEATLKVNEIAYSKSNNVAKEASRRLANGEIVAVFHGRDEWGPRALGNRSILADPRNPKMKDHLNAKIKYREEFRPFAPVVMEEHFARYFETLGMGNSPYMLFTHRALRPGDIAASVHVDNTSRVQTVTSQQNSFLYSILEEFYSLTGVPVLINTSFNLKGEPIVSSPSDALRTFFASGIDVLLMENRWIEKTAQQKSGGRTGRE